MFFKTRETIEAKACIVIK